MTALSRLFSAKANEYNRTERVPSGESLGYKDAGDLSPPSNSSKSGLFVDFWLKIGI